MVYRFSWLIGIAGIGLALARAERLLRPSVEGMSWEIILVMAAVLGAAITWSGLSYRLGGGVIAAVNGIGAALTLVRIVVPSTTWAIFPTLASFPALRDELVFARDVIRTGVAPVIPLSGIIGILALVFWGLGALLAWGLGRHRPYVAVIAPLVVYLEFAVMDRRPSGWWAPAFMVFIGAALIAVALDRRREGAGSLTSSITRLALVRSLPSASIVTLCLALFIGVVSANAVSGLVPTGGYLDWRADTGLSGEFYGGVSYNPFVGIRQDLVSQTNVPVFVADIGGDLPAGSVYWRLVTLDTFDGTQWHIGGDPEISRPEELESFESDSTRFAGPTRTVTQDITVLALQMDWLPAAYSPIDLTAPNTAVDRGYRVKRDDGSLRFDALTYRGMSYTVVSEVPDPDLDVLSRRVDGLPSVVFAGAIDEDEFDTEADTPVIAERVLEDADRLTELPADIGAGVRTLAERTTRGLETDFEKALALESFFRTPGSFAYSTSIVPGHGATELTAWLLDPSSDNYRTGYCEQFATSMAVMARLVGIPSRVVLGFTPGTLLEDGRVLVRARNAHAWVELWMPTQGWVRFDPTPRGDGVNPATVGDLPFDVAQYLDIPEEIAPAVPSDLGSVLFRDEQLLDIPERIVGGAGGDEGVPAPQLPGWVLPVILGGLAVFGLVPGIKGLRRRRRLRRLERGDISAAWREIVDRLTDLGDGPARWATPHEFAHRTDPMLEPLASAYAASVYGPGQPDPGNVRVAAMSLQDTEFRLRRRYTRGKRLRSRYSIRSLMPRRASVLRRRIRARR